MSSKGFLKDKYANHGAAPNPESWSAISAAIPSEKKKKGIVWWVLAGSGAAASLLIAITFFMRKPLQVEHFSEEQTMVDNSASAQKEALYQNEEVEKSTKNEDIPFEIETNRERLEESQNVVLTPKTQPQSRNPIQQNISKTIRKKDVIINQLVNYGTVSKNDEAKLHKEPLLATIGNELIPLLPPRNPQLLSVDNRDELLSKIQVVEQKLPRWQWGGKLGSDLALNSQSADALVFTSDQNQSTGESVPPDSPNSPPGTLFDNSSNNASVLLGKINRPISGSLMFRFAPTAKIFIEIDPSFSMFRAEALSFYNVSFLNAAGNKFNFFSFGSGISIGYKFLNRNRWAMDFAGGINYEKLLNGSLPAGENPVNLIGNMVQLGVNYHFTEHTSLRIAPEFNWVYGNNEDQLLLRQFQNRRSIGIGLSILQDF